MGCYLATKLGQYLHANFGSNASNLLLVADGLGHHYLRRTYRGQPKGSGTVTGIGICKFLRDINCLNLQGAVQQKNSLNAL